VPYATILSSEIQIDLEQCTFWRRPDHLIGLVSTLQTTGALALVVLFCYFFVTSGKEHNCMSELLHFTDLVKVNQIQENFITYHRIFADLPDIRYVEGAATWIVTHEGAPGTQMMRSNFPGDAVDQHIDGVIAEMGQYTSEIDWMVFPGCRPVNLGERLAARGLAGGPDGQWRLVGDVPGMGGNWMYVDLTALPPAPAVSERFHIVRVNDERMLEAWQKLSSEGFGGGEYHNFYLAYARHGFAPDALAHHYIGYLGEQPVTSGTLLLAGGSASIYNVSTPSKLRRQGFGGAITYALMQEMRQRGYTWSWIWASKLGKSVYAKLGFVPTDFGVREYQWRRT
jgi:GNAT superfamily N-acetyltransferase